MTNAYLNDGLSLMRGSGGKLLALATVALCSCTVFGVWSQKTNAEVESILMNQSKAAPSMPTGLADVVIQEDPFPWSCLIRGALIALAVVAMVLLWNIQLRKRAGKAMREGEKRYRVLFDAMGSGVAVYEPVDDATDFIFRDINRAGAELCHVSKQDIIGKRVTEIFPGVKDFGLLDVLQDVARTGRNQSHPVKEYQDTRLARWFENRAYKLPSGNIVAVFDDISAQKRVEEAMRFSELRYRAIFDGAGEGILVANIATGLLMYANAAACRMLDYSKDELVGMNITKLHPADACETVMSDFAAQARGEKVVALGIPFLRKNGTIIPIDMHSTSVVIDAVECLLGFMEDTTERGKIEDQLRQVQRMEAIGRLAGGIAHDFRNQLTVIRGYATLLQREHLVADEGQEHINQILDATTRSTDLTGQLLAISRKQFLRPEIVDINAVIEETVKSLGRIIGEDVHLTTFPCEDLGSVMVDPTQLSHALMNMFTNSRDAMPDGGELIIRTSNTDVDGAFAKHHPDATAGQYVMLSVEDTGVGIDPDDMDKIFDPFYTTKAVGQGTGLGLSMVHGFVRQSGGIVTTDSTPGEGATFRIYFPRVEPQPVATAEPASQDESPSGDETILLAEDEQAVRAMMTRALRERGYTVMETGNAAEALPLGEHFDGVIDLLITDVVMPGMDGVQLADRLTAARRNVKVLLVSGHAAKLLSERGITNSHFNLLSKPFSPTELCIQVRRILDTRQDNGQGDASQR